MPYQEKKNDGFTRKEEGEIDVGWHQVVLSQQPPRIDIKKLVQPREDKNSPVLFYEKKKTICEK